MPSITWNDFVTATQQLGRDINRNPEQRQAITFPGNQSLLIVAGPGSGKTTVLVLRVLKLIFVDDALPNTIIVTTFTKKAASELRSRILGWGDQVRTALLAIATTPAVRNWLTDINLNDVLTGTIDSIAERVLTDNRAPGQSEPLVAEDFITKALMARFALRAAGRANDPDLLNYLFLLNNNNRGLKLKEKSAILIEIKDRFLHDQVNVPAFRGSQSHPCLPLLCDAIDEYNTELTDRMLFDFARLEQSFLDGLTTGAFASPISSLKYMLVDEYQDTNLLQEKIYFQMARYAAANGGSITVVGDDDQSIYRFRGATVELFQNMSNRLSTQMGLTSGLVYLNRNYRSTTNIVDFCNAFIMLDADYQSIRIANKPLIVTARDPPYVNFPVLGLFRDNLDDLADDLADLILNVVNRGGHNFTDGQGNRQTIALNSNGGTPADIALLCSSPQEYSSGGNERLPIKIRQRLLNATPPVMVFNPRGQDLEDIPDVEKLGGLILDCIDPNSNFQNNIIGLSNDAIGSLNRWRLSARAFVATNPTPNNPSLASFVRAWQNRQPLGRTSWEREVSIIDLAYKLITWIPSMQDDIEGLVYLEAMARAISQSAIANNFAGRLLFNPTNPGLERGSVSEAIEYILAPLATGAIDINEDLLETLPSNRVSIMSIHQAKGLEFPFVIVDVGSDFNIKHSSQAFKRFPSNPGRPCNLEDRIRPFSNGLAAPSRPGIDRAFDDLIRHYFVSFSRAQDALLLVGLNPVKDGYTLQSGQRREIPNIATGWDRNENWIWGAGLNNLIQL